MECEYCAQELPLITHQSFDVYVASGWLFADVCPLPMERVKINFCPMCGRKLNQPFGDSEISDLQTKGETMNRDEFVERCSQHWHKLDSSIEPFNFENDDNFCDAFTVAKDLRGNWTALRAVVDVGKNFHQLYEYVGGDIYYECKQTEKLTLSGDNCMNKLKGLNTYKIWAKSEPMRNCVKIEATCFEEACIIWARLTDPVNDYTLAHDGSRLVNVLQTIDGVEVIKQALVSGRIKYEVRV